LDPHDTVSQVVDLLPLFANGRHQLREFHTRTFFEPDSYSVQASYSNGQNRIYSKSSHFRVRKPLGRESTAHDFLVRAAELDFTLTHIMVRAGNVLKTPGDRKELLMKLVMEHPGTRIEKQAKAAIKKIEGIE
jgi:hypothetical protein